MNGSCRHPPPLAFPPADTSHGWSCSCRQTHWSLGADRRKQATLINWQLSRVIKMSRYTAALTLSVPNTVRFIIKISQEISLVEIAFLSVCLVNYREIWPESNKQVPNCDLMKLLATCDRSYPAVQQMSHRCMWFSWHQSPTDGSQVQQHLKWIQSWASFWLELQYFLSTFLLIILTKLSAETLPH